MHARAHAVCMAYACRVHGVRMCMCMRTRIRAIHTSHRRSQVHSALTWALARIIKSPEVRRIYVGSFWEAPLQPSFM